LRIINASEIGSFVYCRRAWWYRRQGIKTQNTAELTSGERFHSHHGWQVFSAVFFRRTALVMLFVAMLVFALYLFSQVV
jgi:hypothetical protein